MTYVIAIALGAGLINGEITLGALISFVFSRHDDLAHDLHG